MRIRKFLTQLILLLLLSLSMSCIAHARLTSIADPSQVQLVITAEGKSVIALKSTGRGIKGYSGVNLIGKDAYYFYASMSGRVYVNCWIKENGVKTYYAAKNGKLASGWTQIGSSIYYFHPQTFKKITGWLKYNNKYYYFNANGVLQTGYKKIGSYYYYLNPAKAGVRTSGWVVMNGNYYYFKKTNGRQYRSSAIIKVGSCYYFLNSNYALQTGLVMINGHTYYFNEDKSKIGRMVTGFKTLSGKTYYFDTRSATLGQAVTGWTIINGSKYYFNTSGVMQKGWLTIGNAKYYFDPNTGVMYTGTHTISGTSYTFASDGKLQSTQPVIPSTGTWYIRVNRYTNVMTVYRGGSPVRSFLCSTGKNNATPIGTYSILDKLKYHELYGPTYGQWCSHITSEILIHSVPHYYKDNLYSVPVAYYNALGTQASMGCIRLACGDAYWIYWNVPIGTTVRVFHGTSADDPLGRPRLVPIKSQNGGFTYDPTDPSVWENQ